MNYVGILKELEGAPTEWRCFHDWLYADPEFENGASGELFEHLLVIQTYWHMCSMDAASELAEFCARMMEIEGCRHEGWIRWIFTMAACPKCTAEYHRCDDGVWRWM